MSIMVLLLKRPIKLYVLISVLIVTGIVIFLTVRWGLEGSQLRATEYQNPIFDHDAPDPTGAVKDEEGYYYVITTQSMYKGSLSKLPIIRSLDLVNWEYAGAVFEELPQWLDEERIDLWAPDFVKHNGKYYVYYSGRSKPNDNQDDMAIGVAVADHPLGPYVDKGEPIIAGPTFTTIDPFVLNDSDGKRYLYWGSASMPIRMQELSEDGMSLVGDYSDVLMPEGMPYEGLLEGAWVIERNGYYYLFVSGDNCCGDQANYAVMVARAESPFGPFEKYSIVNNAGPILESNDRFLAPGHNSIITDEAGQDWMLYHAMDRENMNNGRVLLIDRIDWVNGWPRINEGNGPTSAIQKKGPVTNKRNENNEGD